MLISKKTWCFNCADGSFGNRETMIDDGLPACWVDECTDCQALKITYINNGVCNYITPKD